jgi:hypothetical protein
MRLMVAAILGMTWLLGVLLFHVTAPAFHALGVLAVIAVVGHLSRAIDVCSTDVSSDHVTTDRALRH